MLILTRKPGEAITIQPSPGFDLTAPAGELFSHGPIEVWVRRIEPGKVKMGITAHSNLAVLRDELSLTVPPRLSLSAGGTSISPSHERLASNVFSLRMRRQWSVKQLGEASTLSIGRLCDIENGLTEVGLVDLDRLAIAFNADIAELFRVEGR